MKFTNEDRTRYYGLRVGDIVLCNSANPCEVVELTPCDNNSVELIDTITSEIFTYTAEHCTIISAVK